MQRTPNDGLARAPQTKLFVVLVLGFTWALQFPAALARLGALPGGVESYMLPLALGTLGPVLAAVLAAGRESGRAGIREVFRAPKVGAHWYVVALGMFAAIHVVGTAIYRLLGGSDHVEWLYPPENGEHIAGLIGIPLVEEPGWRGFALPRLQATMSPLRASLVLGAVWAAWHVMMFIVQGSTPFTFAVAMVNVLLGAVVFSWLFNRTRGSTWVAVVAHAGAHLNNPTHALVDGGSTTPFVLYTVAVGVVAVGLVLFDRDAWRSAPLTT